MSVSLNDGDRFYRPPLPPSLAERLAMKIKNLVLGKYRGCAAGITAKKKAVPVSKN
jgi:hypothetical protein